MRQREIIVVFILIGFAILYRPVTAQDIRSLNFDKTTVTGVIQSEQGSPVPGIRLDLELAKESELNRELNLAGIQLSEAINTLKISVGTGTYLSVKTDEKGQYTMKGVPVPGVYYVIVRNDESYLPTRLKLILNSSDNEGFKAPAIVLRIRKGPAISSKAMKMVEKSRKAMAKKEIKKAVKYLKEALKIEPKYTEGHYNLGVLYMSMKKREEAVKCMEKALVLKSDYIPALELLGELYFFKKDYKNAALYSSGYLETKEKEKSLTINDAGIYFRTGNSYRALKQMGRALPYFEKYLDMQGKAGKSGKKDAVVSFDMASWYYQQKNIEKAIQFFALAIKLDPTVGADAYLYIANCYLFKKEGKIALGFYKKYMELYPKGKNIDQVKKTAEQLEKMFPKK